MLSTGNAIHLSHGDLLGRVDSASRNVIAACNLPRFPCTSLDNLKIPHHDVLSCFLTSSLGWGFRCQVATRREIYGPVINSRQQEAVVTWWGSNSPAGKATKRALASTWNHQCPHSPHGQVDWAEVGKRNVPWVLEDSSIHSNVTTTSLTSSDSYCPRLNPLSHISRVLNHSRNV